MGKAVLGVIGGSGLYDMEGLEARQWRAVDTPWGAPSDELCFGRLHGLDMVFLPRHGRGHALSPSEVNYRANMDALKRAGATDVVAVAACGSLRADYKPGEFVLVTQFIDRSFARAKSFFTDGCVAHVSMADPVCARLCDMLAAAAQKLNLPLHREATGLVMEGPQFSSRAESELYRQWGCDTISMTHMPEAKLAREAELPYAVLACVTDYDCWHPRAAAVEVAEVVAQLGANAQASQRMIAGLAAALADFGDARPPSPQGIETVLDAALITPPEARAPAALKKLDAILARVHKAANQT